jgi:hypothetical protein
MVLASMSGALFVRDSRFPLPAYLPPGSSVERVLVEPQATNTFHMEVVFTSPQGSVLRLEHFPANWLQGSARDLTSAGKIVINGREWWYGHAASKSNTSPDLVLLNVESGQMISMEGSISLAELVRVIGSLQ